MNENFFSSQKRILAAFQLKKPDRVPVVLFGVNPYAPYSDDWARRDSRYKRVLQEAVEKTDVFYWDSFPQFYAHCIDGYREEAPVEKDGSVFVEQWIDTPRGQLHSLVRQDKGINTAWRVEPFIKNEEDLKKFQSVGLHPYNQQTVQEFRQTYFKNQEKLGNNGVMHLLLLNPLHEVIHLFPYEYGYMLLYEERKIFHQLLQKVAEVIYENVKSILSQDLTPCIIRFGGQEQAVPPFAPPELFWEYVAKYDRRFVELIKNYQCLVQLHCHGKIGKVLNMIASLQPDALEPIEPPPHGDISLGEVKRKVGNKMCLIGNVEACDLSHCSEKEIDQKVKEAIEDGSEGGGFILCPTSVLVLSKLTRQQEANFLQFIESGLKYGKY